MSTQQLTVSDQHRLSVLTTSCSVITTCDEKLRSACSSGQGSLLSEAAPLQDTSGPHTARLHPPKRFRGWSPVLSTTRHIAPKAPRAHHYFYCVLCPWAFSVVLPVLQSTKSRPRPPHKTHFFSETKNKMPVKASLSRKIPELQFQRQLMKGVRKRERKKGGKCKLERNI